MLHSASFHRAVTGGLPPIVQDAEAIEREVRRLKSEGAVPVRAFVSFTDHQSVNVLVQYDTGAALRAWFISSAPWSQAHRWLDQRFDVDGRFPVISLVDERGRPRATTAAFATSDIVWRGMTH